MNHRYTTLKKKKRKEGFQNVKYGAVGPREVGMLLGSRYVGSGLGSAQKYWTKKSGVQKSEKKISTKNNKMSIYTKKLQKRKRRRKRRIIKKRLPRAIQPHTKVIRMKASHFEQLTCTAGALQRITVQGNSCDDPFTSWGTEQPLGYDQWKALYKSAYVIGSKVIATVHNEGSASVMYGISPMKVPQGQTSLSDYNYYKELPGTTSRMLSPDVDHGTLFAKRNTKRHMKVRNLTDEEDLKLDLVNETAPARQYYYHIWTQPTDKTSTVNVEVVMDVEYIILLKDPIIPSRSTET